MEDNKVIITLKEYNELLEIKNRKDPKIITGINNGSYFLWMHDEVNDASTLRLKKDLEILTSINEVLKCEIDVLKGIKRDNDYKKDPKNWLVNKLKDILK